MEQRARKASVTLETIRKALIFLERRKAHAEQQQNREWTQEYENAIAVIKGLAVYE